MAAALLLPLIVPIIIPVVGIFFTEKANPAQ
jgi:hypothetical protein